MKENLKILIANRGEIACRIIKTCRKLAIKTVAIYSDADQSALHVLHADESVCIDSKTPSGSYLDSKKIIQAAIDTHCNAIIPGYGFLSENATFVSDCENAGLIFVGPTSETIGQFGLKHIARTLAKECNIPIIEGSPLLATTEAAVTASEKIGFPVLLKCSGGGGGIGMQICHTTQDIEEKFTTIQKMGETYFNNNAVYVEKYIDSPRHIEVQIFGDGTGTVVALGDRDCSLQRRFQKVIEETPAIFIDEKLRQSLFKAAITLGEKTNYRSAGTVEFLVNGITGEYYFLEVNTRLQVEHPVTEEVTGIDLIEWMLQLANNINLDLNHYQHITQGHSIEVRLYAEDPTANFNPSTGTITDLHFPSYDWARYDFGIEQGSEITSYFDPMIGKIIVHGNTRTQAIERLSLCLNTFKISGITTNLYYLKEIITTDDFKKNTLSTDYLNSFTYQSPTIEVLKGGFHTTIQDYPGRSQHWRIGVPPSGPVDQLALQTANAIIGNDYGLSGLELTLEGPTLKFHSDAIIAFTGAKMTATLDHHPIDWYTEIHVKAGSVIDIGTIEGPGSRAYMALQGGFKVPSYLGSQSTFCFGQFGGLTGQPLTIGNALPFTPSKFSSDPFSLETHHQPTYGKEWEIGVIYGPHGAPDFFTEEDINMFFSEKWKVHHNSNRLGIRLIGPKPKWARKDGGDAGLHPSNIHDCEYAVGTINFTGDMPIILNCDGPSLGGFVCPATIIQSEFWKLGQLAPNDTITFKRVTYETALESKQSQFNYLEAIRYRKGSAQLSQNKESSAHTLYKDAIVHTIEETATSPKVVYRIAGDNYLLIEYGPLILDLNLRFRGHGLMEWVARHPVSGVLELSPGVRSVQVHYDSARVHLHRLLDYLVLAESQIPDINEMVIPSRILKLPFAYDDQWNREAIDRYSKSVKAKAPYLPSNIEFIARMNGLEDVDQVRQTILNANYLVLGLGDVYLGAPCAVPIDPRHRLVTSKYNPARMYTPEGSVGIGGVYMCVYGMDSPGGYQLVGKTIPIWNKFTQNACFEKGKPWLLRFFDQVQYYQVSDTELTDLRDRFAKGLFTVEIEETVIKPKEINAFLNAIEPEVTQFKQKQAIAFEKERLYWEKSGMIGGEDDDMNTINPDGVSSNTITVPDGCYTINAHTSGIIWDILVEPGQVIEKDKPTIIIEAMKTEITVTNTKTGKVHEVAVKKGQLVNQGDILCIVKKQGVYKNES
jgi:urea carboxylase